MALNPHLPTWGDTPTTDTTPIGGTWTSAPDANTSWEPFQKTESQPAPSVENLFDGELAQEEPLPEVPPTAYTEDAGPLEPVAEEEEPTSIQPTDIFTLIDESKMAYRLAKVFELLYNVKTINNLLPSIYDEILKGLTENIERYRNSGIPKSGSLHFSQEIDITLSLYGVDYAIGYMMKLIVIACTSGEYTLLCDAKNILLSVGYVEPAVND